MLRNYRTSVLSCTPHPTLDRGWQGAHLSAPLTLDKMRSWAEREAPTPEAASAVLELLSGAPRSWRRVLSWLIEHPGPRPVKKILRACAISERTFRTITAGLRDMGLLENFVDSARVGNQGYWSFRFRTREQIIESLARTVQIGRIWTTPTVQLARAAIGKVGAAIKATAQEVARYLTTGNRALTSVNVGCPRSAASTVPSSSTSPVGAASVPAEVVMDADRWSAFEDLGAGMERFRELAQQAEASGRFFFLDRELPGIADALYLRSLNHPADAVAFVEKLFGPDSRYVPFLADSVERALRNWDNFALTERGVLAV